MDNKQNPSDELEQLLRRISEISGGGLGTALRLLLAVITWIQENLAHNLNSPQPQPAPPNGPKFLDSLAHRDAAAHHSPSACTLSSTVCGHGYPAALCPHQAAQDSLMASFATHYTNALKGSVGLSGPAEIPPSIGPARMRSVRFYAIVVGRRIGVFRGPWSRIHEYISGIQGAVYTSHRYREDARNMFLEARRRGETRRVGAARFINQDVIDISDTDSD